MGYVMDTAMTAFVPPSKILKSAGTWTAGVTANVVAEARSAGAAAFNLFVPLNILLTSSDALKGARIKSVELLYAVATAALNSVTTVEVEKVTVSAAGAVSGAAQTAALNSSEDSSAKRLAVGSHRLVVSLASPAWTDNDEAFWLYVTFDAAAGSVFTLYGALVNYDLRV